MSRRVVITGRGIVSCIGNTLDDVATALRRGASGITRVAEFADAGLRSEVAGIPRLEALPPVDRKLRRFMPDAALYAYHAARAAIAEAGPALPWKWRRPWPSPARKARAKCCPTPCRA